ncbi:MAG: CBS domain-containing protein [Proteobacteria bacterium]|nr:CBS domain-containing protein [Pseudomonadota bacterium]
MPKKLGASTHVGKFVRRDPPCVRSSEPVEDALQKMTENSLTVMPVLEEGSEKFLGMITSQEVLDLMIMEARGER